MKIFKGFEKLQHKEEIKMLQNELNYLYNIIRKNQQENLNYIDDEGYYLYEKGCAISQKLRELTGDKSPNNTLDYFTYGVF